MPRPVLPPKGIFVPTSMIYNSRIPPPLLQTWLQLRGLAWGRTITPCIPIKEMAAIIGKSPSTLYRHMSQLRNLAALSWRTTGSGSLIVSFSQQASTPPMETDTSTFNTWEQAAALSTKEALPPILNSQNRESPSHSLIPPESLNSNRIPENDSGITDSNHFLKNEVEETGEGEFEGGRGCAGEGAGALEPLGQAIPRSKGGSPPAPAQNTEPGRNPDAATLHAGPVAAYRTLVHLTPTAVQRRILAARVRDLELWQRTLEHWLGHGWNPRNLTGMLELYQRGGPEGCRYCRPANPARRQPETPLAHTLAAIQSLEDQQEPPPGTTADPGS